MSQAIKKYTLSSKADVVSFADALNFNLAGGNYWMYKDKNKYGFYLDIYENSSIAISALINGSQVIVDKGRVSYPVNVSYIETENYTIMSALNASPNKLSLGCVKAKDLSDNSDTWIYFHEYNNILYYYSNYSSNAKTINYSGSESANAVSMVPMIIEENEKIIQTDYLFYMLNGKKSTINECFTLDENEYMILSIGEDNTRAVVKLT